MNHCVPCWTEFVAGVTHCSDCGEPLTTGPLPDRRQRGAESDAAGAPPSSLAVIDSLLDQIPGEKAEFIAQALKLEGMTCRLECDGLVQHRGPQHDAGAAIAVTLPVSIYVARADLERAREIVDSIGGEDLIGEEWANPAAVEEVPAPEPDPDESVTPAEETAAPEDSQILKREGISPVLVVLLLAVAAVIFMLAR